MGEVPLNIRLKTVAEYVSDKAHLADIGSDHAYLPIYLAQQGKIATAVAGEVVQGPFLSAKASVQEYAMTNNIDVRLGDGLEVISNTEGISDITICGMGGELIAQILERGQQKGHLSGKERLILQPNVAEHFVREWLLKEHYEIIAETILEDNDRLYEIIVAEKTTKALSYTSVQLEHGVYLTQEKPELAKKKWKRLVCKHQYILDQITKSVNPQPEKIAYFKQKIKELEELLA